ncbi:GGDEF domain-containing protein [Aeromonas veronii]|uniref:GGDEF domain-containing protein n=1 Tax=Aeromonas veronii TaxID=654 RepID=UPI003BA212D4
MLRLWKWFIPGMLAVCGLVIVIYSSYQSLIRGMDVITLKQGNVFDVFYHRANILDINRMVRYANDYKHQENCKINSHKNPDVGYIYSYDLNTKKQVYKINLSCGPAKVLNGFKYVVSYPEVINAYVILNDYKLIGVVADGNEAILPNKLRMKSPALIGMPSWQNYFGCSAFTNDKSLCSDADAYISDVEIDDFSEKNIITMYFPFIDIVDRKIFRYGLLGFDIDIDVAFKDVLRPFNYANPTRTSISMRSPESCGTYDICVNKLVMHTKSSTPVYLNWIYSVNDFIWFVLTGISFQTYLFLLLLLTTIWRIVYPSIQRIAYVDRLTNLPKRDFLTKSILHKYDYLMILDVDNFKAVNDQYGHNIGDKVLASFAANLKLNTRKVDIAIRWGGEEFIVLYRGITDQDMMTYIAGRLLEKPLHIDELPTPITFSAGIVRIRDYMDIHELTKLADELLYYVKKNGKNNIAYYDKDAIKLMSLDK